MNNQELQNRLNELEKELKNAQRLNAELSGELSTIRNGVTRARKQLDDYSRSIQNTIENCNKTIIESHQRISDVLTVQGQIEKMYACFKNIETANKKIREANNIIYYDFANYRKVREIVQGLIDNLDLQLVTDEVITESIEAKHLQAPNYWLTCVLLSIMAWKKNDKTKADRAKTFAIKLDKKSSSIFYMMFNLRLSREEAARKWFKLYQNCALKESDRRTFLMFFSLLSKTMIDDVDKITKNEIFTYISKVIDSNTKTANYEEETMIHQIRRFFNLWQPNDTLSYDKLRKYCTDFDQLSKIMMQAKNNINILKFIRKTVHDIPSEERNAFPKTYIDELIKQPIPDENRVYDEITYQNLVIAQQGNVDAAKSAFLSDHVKEDRDLNLISDLIDWIYGHKTKEITRQIRLNMFTITKFLHEKAVDAHVADYRSQRKITHTVTIGSYSTEVNFRNEDAEHNKVSAYFTLKKDEAVAKIKNWGAYFWFGAGVASGVGAFFAGYWLIPIALIAAVCGVGKLLNNKSQLKHLEINCAKNIRSTDQILHQLFTEFKEYQTELDKYDSYYDSIKNEFNKIFANY